MTIEEYKNSKFEFRDNGIYLEGREIIGFWEEEMMRKSALEVYNAVKPRTILEIGYGLGFSASMFDELGVEKHVIIEPHPYFLKAARRWANGVDKILIEDFVQNVRIDEPFDLLYDDMTDFTRIVPSWENFNYTWYGNMPTPEEDCPGFWITIGDKRMWQPLYKKEPGKRSFWGDNNKLPDTKVWRQ